MKIITGIRTFECMFTVKKYRNVGRKPEKEGLGEPLSQSGWSDGLTGYANTEGNT